MSPEEWNSFERCWPFLAPALEKGLPTHTKEQVRQEIKDHLAQLWPMPNSAVVTQRIVFPSGLTILRVWLAGGKLSEIRKVAPFICDWAKTMGCEMVLGGGPNRAWGRVFKGSRHVSTDWVKEL